MCGWPKNNKNKRSERIVMAKKGPGIFLAQFMGDKPPFDTLENICRWAASLGYTCAQLPSWDGRVIDLKIAAESKDYCDELTGRIKSYGLTDGITELATHLQGQLMAVHPAYSKLFDGFAASEVRGNPKARTEWAAEQLRLAIRASANLGLTAMPSFTGSFGTPYYYPWPQRPPGLVEEIFAELARRWVPIFNLADEHNLDVAFELHHGEDVHDGDSYELFLDATGKHIRNCINFDPSHFVLMHLEYVGFVNAYHERIKAYHVKDAEYRAGSKGSTIGGFQSWKNRAGRFRSLGDGEVEFDTIEAVFRDHGIDGPPRVLEWECCVKGKVQGAREGAPFIKALLDRTELPERTDPEPHDDGAFDDFAKANVDKAFIRELLGIE